MQKVIIVGTGCAGLTAAIYTARANLDPLVLEGREPGGQLTSTTLVENFPGFPEGIDGPQLVMNMHRQAEKFGAEFKYAELQTFEPLDGHYRLKVDGESIDAQSVIVASGASAKWLGLEHECKFKGHGVTSCATCDGAFYRNVPVCVIGGGDTATEEAIFLTRFASEVFLIQRRDTLLATKIMAERALHDLKDTAAVLNDRVLHATCNYQPRVRNLFWRLPLQKYRGGGDTEWRSRLQPCVKIMSASERRR